MRIGLEKLLQRCGSGTTGPVSVKNYLEVLESSHISVTEKELDRLEKISDHDGLVNRDDFIEFARKSSSVKEYVEKGKIGVGGGAVSTGAVHNLDKAELAFKAIDKDGSGSIDQSELSKLGGNMTKAKLSALMEKLDTDGDGKITLEEFRLLFKEASK